MHNPVLSSGVRTRCRLRASILLALLAAGALAVAAGDWAALAQLAPLLLLAASLALGCFPGEDAIARARARRFPDPTRIRPAPTSGRARPSRRARAPHLGSLAFGFSLRPPPAAGAYIAA